MTRAESAEAVRLSDAEARQADGSVTAAGWSDPKVMATAALIRADWLRARKELADARAALREVAAFPCASPGSGLLGFWEDCRQREREAMGGTLPPEVQRRHWCARCVAADALAHLPE
jgi:hypothetical protein